MKVGDLFSLDAAAASIALVAFTGGLYMIGYHNASERTLYTLRRPRRLLSPEPRFGAYTRKYFEHIAPKSAQERSVNEDKLYMLLREICEKQGIPTSSSPLDLSGLHERKNLVVAQKGGRVLLDVKSLHPSGHASDRQYLQLQEHQRIYRFTPMFNQQVNRQDAQNLGRLDQCRLPGQSWLLAAMLFYCGWVARSKLYTYCLGPLAVLLVCSWATREFHRNKNFFEGYQSPSMRAFQWDAVRKAARPKAGRVQLFVGEGPDVYFFYSEFVIRKARLGAKFALCACLLLKAMAQMAAHGQAQVLTLLFTLFWGVYTMTQWWYHSYLAQLYRRKIYATLSESGAPGIGTFIAYTLPVAKAILLWPRLDTESPFFREACFQLLSFTVLANWLGRLGQLAADVFKYHKDTQLQGFTHQSQEIDIGREPALDKAVARNGLVYDPLTCVRPASIPEDRWKASTRPQSHRWFLPAHLVRKWIREQTRKSSFLDRIRAEIAETQRKAAEVAHKGIIHPPYDIELLVDLCRDYYYFSQRYTKNWNCMKNPFYVKALLEALDSSSKALGLEGRSFDQALAGMDLLNQFTHAKIGMTMFEVLSLSRKRNLTFRESCARNFALLGSSAPEASLIAAFLTQCPRSVLTSVLEPSEDAQNAIHFVKNAALIDQMARILQMDSSRFRQALETIHASTYSQTYPTEKIGVVASFTPLDQYSFTRLALTPCQSFVRNLNRMVLGRAPVGALTVEEVRALKER